MDFVIGIFGLDLYGDDATAEELRQTGDPLLPGPDPGLSPEPSPDPGPSPEEAEPSVFD